MGVVCSVSVESVLRRGSEIDVSSEARSRLLDAIFNDKSWTGRCRCKKSYRMKEENEFDSFGSVSVSTKETLGTL